MNKSILLSCAIASVILSPSLLVANEMVHGVDVPSIREMRDPSAPSGLDLGRVAERQSALREVGVGNDITTTVVLLRQNKRIIAQLSQQLRDSAGLSDQALRALHAQVTTLKQITKEQEDRVQAAMGLSRRQVAEIPQSE